MRSLSGGTRSAGYDSAVPSLPTILLVLSLPVGAVAYTVTGQLLMALLPPDSSREFIILIVPLFVAGLVMMPLLIPFFDRKARQDLAEHARSQAAAAKPDGDPPEAGPSGSEEA
jgi:hypothetical protein